jgi:hypothetical protein
MQELINWLTEEIIDIECIIDDYEERDLPVPDNLYIILSKYKQLKNALENSLEIANILNNNINHIQPDFIDGYISGNSLIGIANTDLERLGELLRWINEIQ